jgi:hypothetical protein
MEAVTAMCRPITMETATVIFKPEDHPAKVPRFMKRVCVRGFATGCSKWGCVYHCYQWAYQAVCAH